MMRCVRAARNVIDKERLVWSDGVEALHVLDGIIRLRRGQVPAGMADVGIYLRRTAEQIRLPLAGVAADEAIEVVEAHAGWPLIERPGLAGRKRRRVVILAEPGGAIAVIPEDPPNRRLVGCNDAVVAGVAGRLFGDNAEANREMGATGEKGRA